MYEAGKFWPGTSLQGRSNAQQSKDEEVPDRTAEVAFAIAEQGLRAGGEASLIVFLAATKPVS